MKIILTSKYSNIPDAKACAELDSVFFSCLACSASRNRVVPTSASHNDSICIFLVNDTNLLFKEQKKIAHEREEKQIWLQMMR